MDYSKYQYRILCEDRAHYDFVRGWLEQKGAKRRKLGIHGILPHSGSGKEFVKQHFMQALEEVENISTRTRIFLIVVIDADNDSVADTLKNFGGHDDAPVFFVIPKWSMETWIRFLHNQDHSEALDEGKSCKNEIQKLTRGGFTKYGKILAKMNLESPDNIPASLKFTYGMIRNKKRRLNL